MLANPAERARASRLLFQLPRRSRTYCALNPALQWGWEEILANRTNHLIELLLWQNAYNPKKPSQHKANKPKPYVPIFMKQPSEISKESKTMSVDDVKSWLAVPRGI